MPILIDEIIAEIVPQENETGAASPLQDEMPMSRGEYEIAELFALMEERRERLKVD